MILHSSPASPFGRKVKIAATMLGLFDELEIVMTDTTNPEDIIRVRNPLGKIPALVLDDGLVLYDSAVILDYLDHRAGGDLIVPATPDRRYRVLTEAALADGLADAALLQVYENRLREEPKRDANWMTYQGQKVERALAYFETTLPEEGLRSVADIGLACALGYLDLRFAGSWRESHPKLVAWLDRFAAEVPAFEATRFKG
ncbi:glutathione S-transferase family protein [Beijerinckia sp. L45]|uniref:glutathione S-transferase family protein n=1 Tax=Beijerinckia sp. L45 TaxID=1641855 RepID=UPI00131D745E|nr:glutathione S-transferase family protein [Beijerinckia sp. L45]